MNDNKQLVPVLVIEEKHKQQELLSLIFEAIKLGVPVNIDFGYGRGFENIENYTISTIKKYLKTSAVAINCQPEHMKKAAQ